MGRYRGPIVKLSRRAEANLVGTVKVQRHLDKRNFPPGQHGNKRRKKPSDYGVRLREKQKLRLIYNMSEKQFRTLFDEAVRRKGATGTVFLQLLESRLDNVVFRLGIANTRRQARQFVVHDHILVNGKTIDVPSYQLKPGDEVAVAEKSRNNVMIKANVEAKRRQRLDPWVEFDGDTLKGRFARLPAREDINLPVNELMVIEYYSR
ncbi:MAG: 30S ribosomal protein S4 [Deinococcales bacterium]